MTTRILLVDDNALVLEVVQKILLSQDYKVAPARSAELGLELVASQEFDIVISDYQMPGMLGHEFLARVRERYPSMPTVLISGHENLEDSPDVSAMVVKPISGPELIDCVAALVQ